MASLPLNLLKLSLRTFTTAVDCRVLFVTIKSKQRHKCYLCLFTCLASRAIHLEMAYDGVDTGLFWELSAECIIEDKCQKKWFQTIIILWMQSRVAEKLTNKMCQENRLKESLISQGIK